MIPDFPHILDEPICNFLVPNDKPKSPLIDYARGGIGISDASKGMDIQNWRCEVKNNKIYLSSPNTPEQEIEAGITVEIKWVSLAFDQNMHYIVAYALENKEAYLSYYDATINEYVQLSLGKAITPMVRMDDVRLFNDSTRYVVLSYIKNRNLCVRLQSDKYAKEYVLAENAGIRLRQCGMTYESRFQWQILDYKDKPNCTISISSIEKNIYPKNTIECTEHIVNLKCTILPVLANISLVAFKDVYRVSYPMPLLFKDNVASNADAKVVSATYPDKQHAPIDNNSDTVTANKAAVAGAEYPWKVIYSVLEPYPKDTVTADKASIPLVEYPYKVIYSTLDYVPEDAATMVDSIKIESVTIPYRVIYSTYTDETLNAATIVDGINLISVTMERP